MKILALDPGPHFTAWATLNTVTREIGSQGKEETAIVLNQLRTWIPPVDAIVIEMIASYGRPVGAEVFETCVAIGKMLEILRDRRPQLMYRREVTAQLCGPQKGVNDAVIRQRIIDMYGGKETAIGKKAKPGPLYEIKADVWQALALAIAFEQKSLVEV